MHRHSGATILVVENDPELRRVISLRLSGAGHQCVEAGTGAQALSEWQRRSFDVVVSDLNMPGGDGIALADALQRDEAVPIIFITGFREDFKRRLRRVGDVTLLEKPFDPSVLIDLIEATLIGRDTGDDGVRHPHGADGK
ncbi:MAG: response regulator [Planctomycetaceae bacterium]|jgi:CheY-like chemotaxis protein|nr:response regulator [Planctomycetaceae bacterium]